MFQLNTKWFISTVAVNLLTATASSATLRLGCGLEEHKVVGGDGNSLFRAFAHQLDNGNDEDLHLVVREKCVEYMSDNFAKLERFLLINDMCNLLQGPAPIQNKLMGMEDRSMEWKKEVYHKWYCYYMAKNGVCSKGSSHAVLRALATIYKKKIHIHVKGQASSHNRAILPFHPVEVSSDWNGPDIHLIQDRDLNYNSTRPWTVRIKGYSTKGTVTGSALWEGGARWIVELSDESDGPRAFREDDLEQVLLDDVSRTAAMVPIGARFPSPSPPLSPRQHPADILHTTGPGAKVFQDAWVYTKEGVENYRRGTGGTVIGIYMQDGHRYRHPSRPSWFGRWLVTFDDPSVFYEIAFHDLQFSGDFSGDSNPQEVEVSVSGVRKEGKYVGIKLAEFETKRRGTTYPWAENFDWLVQFSPHGMKSWKAIPEDKLELYRTQEPTISTLQKPIVDLD